MVKKFTQTFVILAALMLAGCADDQRLKPESALKATLSSRFKITSVDETSTRNSALMVVADQITGVEYIVVATYSGVAITPLLYGNFGTPGPQGPAAH